MTWAVGELFVGNRLLTAGVDAPLRPHPDRAEVFGEPFGAEHPWRARRRHPESCYPGSHRVVHLLDGECTLCHRGLICTAAPLRVSANPKRITCLQCLQAYFHGTRHNRDIYWAIQFWRSHGHEPITYRTTPHRIRHYFVPEPS